MSGSVHQEANGSHTFQFWYIDPQSGRRKHVKRRGYASKKEAASAMRKLQVRYETTGPESAGKMSLGRYLELWFERQSVDKAPATNDRYKNAVSKHLQPAMGSIRLTRLAPLHIEHFLSDKLSTGLSEETVNGFYRVLNTALKDAVRWGYLSRNPAENVSPPKKPRAETPTMALDEQAVVRRLLEAESEPASLFYRRNGVLSVSSNMLLWNLAALTGMRRGEIAGLQFADVDHERRVIHVRRSVSESEKRVLVKPPKTARGLRQVDIDDYLLQLITQHRDINEEHREALGDGWNSEGWLFASAEGGVLAPRALNAKFSRLLKRAGLGDKGYGLHTLRHTHISQLLMRNVPPLVVSRRAGHASTATTMNLYGHVISQMAEGVIASHLREIQHSWV